MNKFTVFGDKNIHFDSSEHRQSSTILSPKTLKEMALSLAKSKKQRNVSIDMCIILTSEADSLSLSNFFSEISFFEDTLHAFSTSNNIV